MNSKIKLQLDTSTKLPPFLQEKDLHNTISSLGLGLNYDTEDNIFSPNKGTKVKINYKTNANGLDRDYNFKNFKTSVFQYFQTTVNLASGFRFDTKFICGNAPLYIKPPFELKRFLAARYQGTSTYVIETEQRYDFTMRWSGIAFTGLGKALPEGESFSDAQLVYNYGVGFRYLLARVFKLRVGIDVAKTNKVWGYYIAFGSTWYNKN